MLIIVHSVDGLATAKKRTSRKKTTATTRHEIRSFDKLAEEGTENGLNEKQDYERVPRKIF